MKVAIITDSITNTGGAERVILEQAKYFNADVYVALYSPGTTFKEFSKLNIKKIMNVKLPNKIRTIYLWHIFASLKLKKKYDFYIFHGAGAINASKKLKPNVWYCHSPSRYLYDLYKHEMQQHKGLSRILYKIVTRVQRIIDQKNVRFIDQIFVNSKNVEKRVLKYYGRKSKIVYPSVNTKKFKFLGQKDYYLSTARLDRIKRVDLVIKAFKKMPNKKLIIISDGPDKSKLHKLASGASNIKFLGRVSDEKLATLYGNCIATLYLSYKEDFGIIPLESMAAGKPCIATNDGGFQETIKHDKTGFLIDNPEDISNVINAVNYVTSKKATSMKQECIKTAEKFSLKSFIKEHIKTINELTHS
jgi:glycosyltransferase involved in cell wall biosynthesis